MPSLLHPPIDLTQRRNEAEWLDGTDIDPVELESVLRDLASFTTGDAAELAAKLNRLLGLPQPDRAALSAAARAAVVERWSWAGVAHRLLELA